MSDFKPGDRVHMCVMHERKGDVRGDPVAIDGQALTYELISEPYQVEPRVGRRQVPDAAKRLRVDRPGHPANPRHRLGQRP